MPASAGVRAPGERGRALVLAAREALLADEPEAATLMSLARLLQVSPYHLSRVFRRETGLTLTRYRNRLRVSRALDLIEQGAGGLADVAATVGFADQAHLTRTMRAELGRTPAGVRRLLASAGATAGEHPHGPRTPGRGGGERQRGAKSAAMRPEALGVPPIDRHTSSRLHPADRDV